MDIETFAPCPRRQNTQARMVNFTWWGGFVGPTLLTHVTCERCGNRYNGKTGKSNTVAIALYAVVATLIGLAIAYFFLVTER